MNTPFRRATDSLSNINPTKIVHPLFRAIYYAITVLFAVGFSFTALFIYWINYPYNVLDIKEPVQLLHQESNTYHPGDTVVFKTEYCKKMDTKEASIERSMISETREITLQTLPVYSTANMGCAEGRLTAVVPPSTAEPGEYYFRYTIVYRTNPIREIKEVFITVPINVVIPIDTKE